MNRKERRRQEKERKKTGGPLPAIIPLLDAAYAHQQAGRFTEAAAGYEEALRFDPNYAPAHDNLGVVLAALGRTEDAADHHRQATVLQPASADAHYNLGTALLAGGHHADAATAFARAIQINPADADAHHNLGTCLHHQDRWDDAAMSFRRALELAPHRAETLNNLGAVLVKQGQPTEAEHCLRQALEIEPAHVGALDNLGSALIGQGRPEDAVASLDRALELSPERADTRCNLGTVLMSLGRVTEATKAFEHCHAIDPSNTSASHMIAAAAGQTPATAPREFVEKLFDAYAGHFEDHLVQGLGYRVPEQLRELVGNIDGHPATFAQALDLGCGTGLMAAAFADLADAIDGVDLSPQMIAQAKASGRYRAVHVDDAVDFLAREEVAATGYDLILAADVLIYLGDPAPLFQAVGGVLAPEGLFGLSIELTDQGPYTLLASGRFAHAEESVRALVGECGFAIVAEEGMTIRTENGVDIAGLVLVLQKAG